MVDMYINKPLQVELRLSTSARVLLTSHLQEHAQNLIVINPRVMPPAETSEAERKRKLELRIEMIRGMIESEPIPSVELVLRRVLLSSIGATPPVSQKRVVLQLRTSGDQDQYPWFYDLDIGYLADESKSHILVLRKSYFVFYYSTATKKKLKAYPDYIWVSSVKYKLHHCTGEEFFCWAVPVPNEVRLDPPALENIHSDSDTYTTTAPPMFASVLLAGKGQHHSMELLRGKLLWPACYGEVYQGYLLKGCRVGEEAVFDHRQAQKVAIKVVRHLNDHNRSQLECVYHSTEGESISVKHHAIAADAATDQATSSATVQATTSPMTPTPPQVRTSHLKPFFENLRVKHGLNENWMNEIEMMVLIQKSIEQLEAASEFCDARATAAALRRRFLPLGGVGLCSNNLFIATKYLPFGSVFDYVRKYGRLDERCCKHVIFQVLHCVNFLHECGIADQDLSPENLLLQAPTEAKQELLDQRGKKLSQADFLQMEVVMIDRGQASVHGKCETDSCCSSGGSTKSRRTEDSADTATTCESSSGRSDLSSSGCLNFASPVPQHRLGGANTSDTTSPHAHNSFLLLKNVSKTCVGKRTYHSPQLSPYAASARIIYAKRISKASADVATAAAATPFASPELSNTADLQQQQAQKTLEGLEGLEGQEEIVVPVPESEYYCGMCVDMWHIGVMIIYLITGRLSFDYFAPNPQDTLRNEVTWYEDLANDRLAARAVEWIDELGVKERSTLGAMLPADCFDLLKQLLRFDPDQRISAEQALQHRWFHGLNIA